MTSTIRRAHVLSPEIPATGFILSWSIREQATALPWIWMWWPEAALWGAWWTSDLTGRRWSPSLRMIPMWVPWCFPAQTIWSFPGTWKCTLLASLSLGSSWTVMVWWWRETRWLPPISAINICRAFWLAISTPSRLMQTIWPSLGT